MLALKLSSIYPSGVALHAGASQQNLHCGSSPAKTEKKFIQKCSLRRKISFVERTPVLHLQLTRNNLMGKRNFQDHWVVRNNLIV